MKKGATGGSSASKLVEQLASLDQSIKQLEEKRDRIDREIEGLRQLREILISDDSPEGFDPRGNEPVCVYGPPRFR